MVTLYIILSGGFKAFYPDPTGINNHHPLPDLHMNVLSVSRAENRVALCMIKIFGGRGGGWGGEAVIMGEVSLETSLKNIMIQDMINSKTA